ncbi:MAG TPA: VanZ family protein [Bacillales bacterium]|nr:VanZ family protein [Bacillales bacterium]
MKTSIKLTIFFSQILYLTLMPIWMKLTQYLHPLVIGVVWFCWTFFILLFGLWMTKEKIAISKGILNLVTICYSIGLLILLFFRPENQYYGSINLVPFKTITFYLEGRVDLLIAIYNLGANIGLFVPFGVYYCFVKDKPRIGQLLIISIFSIAMIEGAQFVTKRGSLDIDDLILNLLGVFIGYLVFPVLKKVLVLKEKNN